MSFTLAGAMSLVLMLVTLVLPWALTARPPRSRAQCWLVSSGCVGWIGVASLLADWSALSIHLRLLAMVQGLVAVAVALRTAPEPRPRSIAARLFSALVGLACLALLGLASWLHGSVEAPDVAPAVRLRWPLVHARGYVMQGGSTLVSNHHAAVPAQRRAIDVVALDAWGARTRRLVPRALSDFVIYDSVVEAPCPGLVAATRSDEPERPLEAPLPTARVAGNFVLLECDAPRVTVMLAHLQPGLAVRPGQHVASGAPLGRVGNTGRSTEPHLHIHAVGGRVDDVDVASGGARLGLALIFEGTRRAQRGDQLVHENLR